MKKVDYTKYILLMNLTLLTLTKHEVTLIMLKKNNFNLLIDIDKTQHICYHSSSSLISVSAS